MYLKLLRAMRGTPLAYVVQCHGKVALTPPESAAYLNLNKEMIGRALIVNTRSNLRLNQDSLDKIYANRQTDTFKVENAMVYKMFSKMFTDINVFVYLKQRRGMQDS